MIKITEQEYYEITGINLSSVLPKDQDSKQAERFLNRMCDEVERFIKKYNPKFYNDYNLPNITKEQKEIIKKACIEHALYTWNTGSYYYEPNGLAKKIPISQDVKDILTPLLYRGL